VNVEGEEENQVSTIGGGMPDMSRMKKDRDLKMARYKQTKQLEQDMVELRKMMGQEGQREDEVVRDYYQKMIQRHINTALDELCSLEMEVGVLRHMAKVKAGMVAAPSNNPPDQSRRLQPIIITKDKLQKEVYGMGYPAIPILSVDEFYEKRVADGWWKPPPATGTALQDFSKDPDLEGRMKEQEEKEEDDKTDRDDPEARAKKQGWDDYTDEHRRGEGNRHNMG